jgi:hypothetical protein
MSFLMLGGLFQVYRWIITNFNSNLCFSEKLLSLLGLVFLLVLEITL